MPKYMVVFNGGNETGVSFRTNYEAAKNFKMDVECGLGLYAEIYVRETGDDGMEEYRFLEA